MWICSHVFIVFGNIWRHAEATRPARAYDAWATRPGRRRVVSTLSALWGLAPCTRCRASPAGTRTMRMHHNYHHHHRTWNARGRLRTCLLRRRSHVHDLSASFSRRRRTVLRRQRLRAAHLPRRAMHRMRTIIPLWTCRHRARSRRRGPSHPCRSSKTRHRLRRLRATLWKRRSRVLVVRRLCRDVRRGVHQRPTTYSSRGAHPRQPAPATIHSCSTIRRSRTCLSLIHI